MTAEEQRPNWFVRNWKWCVPLGCLSTLAIMVAFVAFVVTMVFGLMKSSDVYQRAVATAKADVSVQQALGTPIQEGFFVSGNVNVSGPSGQADLSIPLEGPRSKASLYVIATKSGGQWTFSTLIVEMKDTGQRVDLID